MMNKDQSQNIAHGNIVQPTRNLDLHQQQQNTLRGGGIVRLPVDALIQQQPISEEGIATMELCELCDNANAPCGFCNDLPKLLKNQAQQNVDISLLPSRQVFVDSAEE